MELMLVSDVARECGVTPATVKLWERAGRLPAIRTARGVRLFRRSDVEALRAERAAEADAESELRTVRTA